MNIAFLGLGNMGTGIAHCLLRAGHSLRVWNRTEAKTKSLVDAGAIACATPVEAIAGVPLVISSLMDDQSVQTVFDGPNGVIRNMTPNAIHLCTMTISPHCADWLAQEHKTQGSRYVSGPVVGRPDAAAAGTLLEFLSGDASAIEELKPVCAAFANNLMPIPGAASIANRQKLCVNFFIISQIEVMAECLTLAGKSGASPEIMAAFFDRCFAHPGLKGYAKRLFEKDVDGPGGFSMRGGLKDVGLMLDTAKAVECPLDLAAIIQEKMQACIAQGWQDADWAAILRVTRQRAGLS